MKEKCDWVPMLLQPIKESMNGAKIEFRGKIDQEHMSSFNNHETLLEHIGNELLPIWNNCCRYEFDYVATSLTMRIFHPRQIVL